MSALLSRVLPFAVAWTLFVGLCTLWFIGYMHFSGSRTVDLGAAQNEASYLVRPGPWNGGNPWSQEEADVYVQRATHLFWSEVWASAAPYLAVAGMILFVGSALIGVTSFIERRAGLPHR